MLSYGNVRPRVALVALILLSCATCWATSALQSDMDNVLRSDPRNSGILVSVGVRDGGSSLVYNLTSVGPTNSMSDVFRIFLQFASAEKGRDFKAVELSARGRPKFTITGSYFKQLGQEYGTQNPVYTIRTFPENLTKMDGSRAFPTWTGGWLGVSSKQINDFNEFHQQWWLKDFAPGLASATLDVADVSAATSMAAPQVENSQPVVSSAGPANSSAPPSAPIDTPKWLGIFPGSRDLAKTPSPGAIAVSYAAPASPDEVVRFYREHFDQDDVAIHVGFNGVGTTIQALHDNESCVIRVGESSVGATVSALCAIRQAGTAPVAASVAPPALPAGVHRVEYSIGGSAAAVGLTYRNATGGTEQRDVRLPGSLSFNAVAGQFVYISAQNRTNTGDVHVSITVDGRPLQEATSTTPFGIAAASGSVPR
jgi:hypothetical protein